MGLFNFGKKKKEEDKRKSEVNNALGQVDKTKLSRKERFALKMFEKMPQKKQEEVMRKAMNPQTIQKDKHKILKQLNDAVASGEMDKQEAETIKSQLGLR